MPLLLRRCLWCAAIVQFVVLLGCAGGPENNGNNSGAVDAPDPARMLRSGDAAGARHLLLKLSQRTCEQELMLSEASLKLHDTDEALRAALQARGMANDNVVLAHRADLAAGEAFLAINKAEEALAAFTAARKNAANMQDRDRATVCCARAELARGGVEAARRLRNEILRSDIRELADLDRRLAQVEKPSVSPVIVVPGPQGAANTQLLRRPPGKGLPPPSVHARSTWNARPIKLRNEPVPMGKVTCVTVHHTADPNGLPAASFIANAARVRAYQSAHQDTEKWADIGYHFIIDRQGRIFEGRELCWQGAHAGNEQANLHNVGIALMGDFERMKPNEAQSKTLSSLLGWLVKEYSLSWSVVKGHNDVKRAHMAKGTSCPGKHLATLLAQLKQKG